MNSISKIVAVVVFLAAFATISFAQTPPPRLPSAEGRALPERDQSMERLKSSWTPFALAVARGERQLPRISNGLLRLLDPIEEFGEARLQFVNQEPRSRGVGLLVQLTNSGKVFNWEWLSFPNGLGRGEIVQLPVLDPRQGSGAIKFFYFPESLSEPAGQLGIAANYPLVGGQPENPAVAILRRTFLADGRGYGEVGFEFEVEAEGGLVSTSVDGRPVNVVVTQLPYEGNKKQVFLLPLTALNTPHVGAPPRTVEITFCTVAGQCISEALTPRIPAYRMPMDQ